MIRKSRKVWASTVGLAVIIGLSVVSLGVGVKEAYAATCTHWASPSGGGNGLSAGSPFQIANFWGVGGFGSSSRVLCLLNGTYTDSNSRIHVPVGINGTQTNPVTLQAVNEGAVVIDGGDAVRPLIGRGSWFIVEGIDFTRGDNSNIVLDTSTDHWIVRRGISWNCGANGDNNARFTGKNSLLEDFALFGACRKQLFFGTGFDASTTGNVARRVWSRFEDNTHPTSNPTDACQMGYGQDGVLFENVICTRKYIPAPGGRGPTEAEGASLFFRSDNSRYLSSIFYTLPGAGNTGGGLFSAYQDAGSGAPIDSADNNVFDQFLASVPSDQPLIRPIRFNHVSQYPAGTNNVFTNMIGIGGTTNLTATNPSFTNGGGTQWVATVGGLSEHPFLTLDGLCFRRVDGVVTTQPLWPWPMNQRIIDRLDAAGYTGSNVVDVTATMASLFGTIPAICKTGGGGGALLSNLVVNDTANAADWSLRTNIQSGDQVYGDRASTWTSVPALVDGEEWIRTANDSKAYTGDPVATFKVNANATVYIGHNDAITTKPSWMSTWTDTGQNLTNTDGNTMSLFSKTFTSGATVQLGPNGHTSFAMYTVIVDAT